MITTVLVLSVLLSFGFIFFVKPEKGEALRLLLSFSGAFLLALTIFELLPEVYSRGDGKTVGVFIILGILLQIFLEFFSKGAEHGHMHLDSEKSNFPWLLFVSLSIHAFVEGIPVEGHHPMLYGVLVHKVPIALILSIFLLNSKIGNFKALMFILFFSIMTPLGHWAAGNYPFIGEYYIPITSLVIGVFLHISTIILFESSEGHSFNLRKLFVILLGMGLAFFL